MSTTLSKITVMSKQRSAKKQFSKTSLRKPEQPSQLAKSVMIKERLKRSQPYNWDSQKGSLSSLKPRQPTLGPDTSKSNFKVPFKRKHQRTLSCEEQISSFIDSGLDGNVFTQSYDVQLPKSRSKSKQVNQLKSYDAAALSKSNIKTPKERAIRESWATTNVRSFARNYNIQLKKRSGFVINDQEIKEGLATFFGKEREQLWPGELSLILRALTSMVEEDPEISLLSPYELAKQALIRADLQRLETNPKVLDQIQDIWKEHLKKAKQQKPVSQEYIISFSRPGLFDTKSGEESPPPLSNRFRRQSLIVKHRQ